MVKVARQKCGHRVPWGRPPELFSYPNPLSSQLTSARVAVRPACGLRRLAMRLWPRRLGRAHADGYCARP